MSWNFNYGPFSRMATGDDSVLLKNPDMVGEDGYLAFLSALWFYMLPQAPKPSMHEIATHQYVPNAADKKEGLGSNFGSAIMVINGGLECTTGSKKESIGAQKRAKYYRSFLDYFGLPAEKHLGCATMKPFSSTSASDYPQYLDRNWAQQVQCKVVNWETQFSIFAESDYKRCICYNFAKGDKDCLSGKKAAEEEELIEVETFLQI